MDTFTAACHAAGLLLNEPRAICVLRIEASQILFTMLQDLSFPAGVQAIQKAHRSDGFNIEHHDKCTVLDAKYSLAIQWRLKPNL